MWIRGKQVDAYSPEFRPVTGPLHGAMLPDREAGRQTPARTASRGFPSASSRGRVPPDDRLLLRVRRRDGL
jgi:hypothetical protein